MTSDRPYIPPQPPPDGAQQQPITIRIPVTEYERLRRLSYRRREHMSAIMREGIKRYLDLLEGEIPRHLTQP